MQIFKSFGRLFQTVLVIALMALFVVPAFADYLAMPDDVVKAHETKKAAVKARDNGDFDTAASRYKKAASEDPQEAYKAIYLLNAVGCLLSSSLDRHGNYAWDADRGAKNSVEAYGLLAEIDSFLTKAEADEKSIGHPDGVYANNVIEKARDWYIQQVAWLQVHGPAQVATPVAAVVTPK